MRNSINKAINLYLNKKSFKTARKFVVIESDDWGSTRTKDKNTLNKLNFISHEVASNPYIQFDSIASSEDLDALFNILNSVKDKNGNPACITANVCTANPDFKTIKDSDFNHFFFKPFTNALENYSESNSLFTIWLKAMSNGIFKPQLHGREHLNALAWLGELKAGNKDLLKAFDLESWGIPYKAKIKQKRKKLQAALDMYLIEDEEYFHYHWIKDSVSIFEESFGYPASSFIAPSYIWHSRIHNILSEFKIQGLQGIKLQYEPKLNQNRGYKKRPHYIGQVDKKSQLIFTHRNSFFEPYQNQDKDWVDIAFNGVKAAFENNNPAIIGSHRLNFVGRLDIQFRDKNLRMIKSLLQKIVKAYPDVEFIDSGTLINHIRSESA